MAKMTSVRVLMALAVARRWPLYQMDIKNVLLNDDLSEIVYMQLPPVVLLHLDMYADFDELFMI